MLQYEMVHKGEPIKRENEVIYLGVMLSNNSNSHTRLRLKAGRGAFYKLHGVGLCANGLNPQAVATVFNHVIQPILTYGMNCVHSRKILNTTQCKLLKAAPGSKNRCRNTPLLNALHIKYSQSNRKVRGAVAVWNSGNIQC